MDALCVGRSAVDRRAAEDSKRSPYWPDQHRMGPQPKLTAAQLEAVKRFFSQKQTCTEAARALTQIWGLVISRMPVAHIWHSCHLPCSYQKNTFLKAVSLVNELYSYLFYLLVILKYKTRSRIPEIPSIT